MYFISFLPCNQDARVRFALQKNLRTELIDHRITMALNVLSWLCDGQQKDMQDILRDEKTFSVCVTIKFCHLLSL